MDNIKLSQWFCFRKVQGERYNSLVSVMASEEGEAPKPGIKPEIFVSKPRMVSTDSPCHFSCIFLSILRGVSCYIVTISEASRSFSNVISM